MTLLALCLAAFAVTSWAGWRLCTAGIDAGDRSGDATTEVGPGARTGTVEVVVRTGPAGPVVVGAVVVSRARWRPVALASPLVVRTYRRRLGHRSTAAASAAVLGAVPASGTGRWVLAAGADDRVVVTVGQPGGRLQRRDHAVVTAAPLLPTGRRL